MTIPLPRGPCGRLAACFAAILLAWSPGLAAEPADQPTFVSVLQVDVKSGSWPAYEQLIKQFIEANNKLETDNHWSTSIVQYGPGNRYQFASWHEGPAGLQWAPEPILSKAYGPEAARDFMATLGEVEVARSSAVWMQRPDLSRMPERGTRPVNLNMISVKVAPMGNVAYEEYMAQVVTAFAAEAPDVRFIAHTPMWGADNTYIFVGLMPSMDQLGAPGPGVPAVLAAHYGERTAAKILAARAAVVEEQQLNLAVVRPELSRVPQDQMAATQQDAATLASAD